MKLTLQIKVKMPCQDPHLASILSLCCLVKVSTEQLQQELLIQSSVILLGNFF